MKIDLVSNFLIGLFSHGCMDGDGYDVAREVVPSLGHADPVDVAHTWTRIVIFWFIVVVLTSAVVIVVCTDWISWDRLSHGFLQTDELSRAFLASFILVFDLLIVMQVNIFNIF